MNGAVQSVVTILVLAIYASLPAIVIHGWFRWAHREQPRSRLYLLSVAGFTLGNGSVLLAASMVIYSILRGGFPYYDPWLLRFMGVGFVVSLVALVFAIPGAFSRNPLRWHAPALSFGMLLFWFFSALSE
jgi:hypothetical protein